MGIDMRLFSRPISCKNTNIYDDEIASWWGGNQIREWFIRNTGYNENSNEITHPVTKCDLVRLVTDCKEVLKDSSRAKEILPIVNKTGYIDYMEYGSTEYFQTIIDTIEAVEGVLIDFNWDKEQIYYYECW